MADICGNCRHWFESDDGAVMGECRRNAPSPSSDGVTLVQVWPQTAVNDWCGEWKPQQDGWKPGGQSDE